MSPTMYFLWSQGALWVLVSSYCFSSYRAASPFGSLGPLSSSFIGHPVLHPRFGFSNVFQIFWMFCDRNFIDLAYFVVYVSISSNVSCTHEIHSSISFSLLVILVSAYPVIVPWFPSPFSLCSPFCFYFHFLALNSFIHFLHQFAFIVLYFFNGFIYSLKASSFFFCKIEF